MREKILALIACAFLTSCASNKYYDGPTSDHFDGKTFHNKKKDPHKGIVSFTEWKIVDHKPGWPKNNHDIKTDKPPAYVKGNDLRLTYVGHSTVLLQTQGMNILTDPIWSSRAGPDGVLGAKRVTDPGIAWNDLPKIDVVLISHNHYDHMDIPTLKKLWLRDKPYIMVPLGNDRVIKKHDPTIKSHALDWYQYVVFNEHVSIYLEPSQHWSRRFIGDRDDALWSGFVIKTSGGNIFYSGDTGYGEGENFRRVYEQHKDFRLALLPIGSYEPRWYLAFHHINPEEAVKAHIDLGKPNTVGVHFDTFPMGDDKFDQPLQELKHAREKYQVSEDAFRTLKPGEVWWVP